MPTLAIGDHVMAADRSHDGKLVDIDGRTAYVMQANGVELEFPLDRLVAYQPPKLAETRTLSGPNRDRLLSPQHRTLLASVPAPILAAIARSYEAGGDGEGGRPVFAALPEDKRLEVVRIYLPTLPQRLLAPHMALVVALRDLSRPAR